MKDPLRYDKMIETALRGVVREALAQTSTNGLPGNHHFYVTFNTQFSGVVLPDSLAARYPQDMTIVLEHQFWDLAVSEASFSVTLSFQNRPERLTVPFEAITAFVDPSVEFALQFQGSPGEADAVAQKPVADKPEEPAEKAGQVVTLDAFRKK